MNRQIKFRGKPIDPYYDVDFVYGFYMEDLKGGEVVPYIFDEQIKAEVFSETVGQFSGLKDKNGTEIYEGDIFGITTKDEKIKNKFYRVVKWVLDGYYLVDRTSHGDYGDRMHRELGFNKDYCGLTQWIKECGLDYELIGTIHTTPELLTDKPTNNE